MAKAIEVDEEEYGRKSRVFDTLAKIAKNPAAAKLLEQAHKAVDPNVPTPLLDAEKTATEPYAALKKEFDEFKASVQKEKDEAAVSAKQAAFDGQWKAGQATLKQRGYTPEAIEKFEKEMAEKGVTDHVLFVDAWEKRNPPPPPAVPSAGTGGSWNFAEVPENAESAGDKFVKDLITTQGKQDYVADRAANLALQEFRKTFGARN